MIKEYPATAFNLSNFLADILAHSQALRDKIVAANFKPEKNVVEIHLQGIITTQDETDLQTILNNHNEQPDSPFVIMAHINPDFKGMPIENIDFKRHLRTDIAYDKRIVMHPNGRPDKAQYIWDGEVVCEIRFTFQDSNYLLTEKCQHLYQRREDGSYSEGILIGKRTYDHTDLVDGSIVVEERIDARRHIITSMKAFLSGVMMQALQKNMDEVIIMISDFWDATEVERRKFQEFGTDEWKQYLANLDMSGAPGTGTPEFGALVVSGDIKNAPYYYLMIPIDANGTTVRDYMIGRMTY